jgi:hypothetical protein
VPTSCNSWWWYYRSKLYTPIAKYFDWDVSEISAGHVRDLPGIWSRFAENRRRDRALMLTSNGRHSLTDSRRLLAACYALGGNFIVPWDQYVHYNAKRGQKRKPRVFLKPAEIADLYGFVRAVPQYLDGCEPAVLRMPDGKVEAPEVKSAGGLLTLTAADGKTPPPAAMLRVRPGEPNAPAVLHLFTFGKKGRPTEARVSLKMDRLFPGKAIQVTLLRPAAYDAAVHAKVRQAAEKLRGDARRGPQQAEAFAPLVRRQTLEAKLADGALRFTVPALHPWGVLVIRPAK